MAGIFGVVSGGDCIKDLYLGTFYLQHRAQDYCGLAFNDSGELREFTHRGLLRQQFSSKRLRNFKGNMGIGSVSVTREPVSFASKHEEGILTYDGNVINKSELINQFLEDSMVFSGYKSPEDVQDSVLISMLISGAPDFETGISRLLNEIHGDFSVVALTKRGVYAARGWGRKPLILGEKEIDNGKSYAVSSESNSFINTRFKIQRDVEPGEAVLLNNSGVHSLKRFYLGEDKKFGTFEWIYTAYPPSVIDGKSVAEVRKKIGAALAKRYPVEADVVSPIPNSGRWHGIGYSEESGIPYEEVYSRYDYSDRSYTPGEQCRRDEEAELKLIPIEEVIKGKRIILVDDSIVRGTQTKKQTKRLWDLGALEVHGRIACPPLMAACQYGKSTKEDKDCIARVMSIDEIRKTRGFDTLGYATVDDLEEAIGIPRERLCLDCWGCTS